MRPAFPNGPGQLLSTPALAFTRFGCEQCRPYNPIQPGTENVATSRAYHLSVHVGFDSFQVWHGLGRGCGSRTSGEGAGKYVHDASALWQLASLVVRLAEMTVESSKAFSESDRKESGASAVLLTTAALHGTELCQLQASSWMILGRKYQAPMTKPQDLLPVRAWNVVVSVPHMLRPHGGNGSRSSSRSRSRSRQQSR